MRLVDVLDGDLNFEEDGSLDQEVVGLRLGQEVDEVQRSLGLGWIVLATSLDLVEDLSGDLVLEDVLGGDLDLVDVLGCRYQSWCRLELSSEFLLFCFLFSFEDCLGCVDTSLRRLGYLLFSGGPFVWSSPLGSGF